MRKLSGAAAAIGVMLIAPAAAFAQGTAMPEHELGVDLGVVFNSVGRTATSPSSTTFGIATPVDVRIGFVTARRLSWEGRLTLNFATTSSSGTTFTEYSITPDLNVLYGLGTGGGPHRMMGPYLTGGLGVNLAGSRLTGGTSRSGVNVTINAGVGTRQAFGPGAGRGEFFVAYTPKNSDIGPYGNEITIGLRLGLSLWH